MKKKYLFVLFFIGGFYPGSFLWGQCEGDIVLTTQSEVNAFVANNCTEIIGDLTIGDSFDQPTNIVNLLGLLELISITGNLQISNNDVLINLDGFNSLTSVGGDLLILDNSNLANLDGLNAVTSIGNELLIYENDNLANLVGLNSLTSIGAITIYNNNNLTNLDGLSSLTSIDDYLFITENSNLENISGLSSVISVGSVLISYNATLANIDGFSSITSFGGGLSISNNHALTNLDGLSFVTSVTGNLQIYNNDTLPFIDSLISVPSLIGNSAEISNTSLDGDLIIKFNGAITNLDGLSSITSVGGNLSVSSNEALGLCCVVPYLVNSTLGSVSIYNNAPGCNSIEEITESCGFSTFFCRAFLEGPYQGEGLMSTSLGGSIPENQPYNDSIYNYSGIESINLESGELDSTEIVDWVLVEARTGVPGNGSSPGTTVVERHAGLLLSDGNIVNTGGTTGIRFLNLLEGESCYFAIRHRNHLDILSATPLERSLEMTYDFTTSVDQAYGLQQQKMSVDGFAMLYGGDANADGIIQTSDYDMWFLNNAVLNTYSPTDWNLDGVIQTTDYDLWFINRSKVGSVEIQDLY